MANGREIVDLLITNDVEIWLKEGRLLARWKGEGAMSEGAAKFIRRFKPEIIQELERSESSEGVAA
jgi:hypothetical protein